tara:strand:- start:328 stop:1458 length:1131 start_codon:yes stop_codon:yes gene_type:complete
MQTEVLSQNIIETKTKEAISAQSLTKRVSTRDLRLIDENHVEVNGHTVKITKDAYKGLIKALDLPQSFTNKLDRLFNKSAKVDFINTLSKAIATLGTSSLNVLVSPISKTIVGFSKASNIITNETFFELTNKIIDGQGFDVSSMYVDPTTGGVQMNAMLNKHHEIKGLTNEAFKSGLTISNNPNTGIVVSPYMNRLWCANGCTTSMAQESYQLNDLSVASTGKFFEHINKLRKDQFIPAGYGDMVREANQTPASIAEVDRAFKLIKPFVGERANSIIPKERNYNAYNQMGVDLNTVGVNEKKNAQSNQSVWSLVNALTWVGTNSDKVLENNIQDRDRMELQIAGGNLLSKQYDLKNRMRSPFQSLNSDDQIGALLN